jgi:hypothetical protein
VFLRQALEETQHKIDEVVGFTIDARREADRFLRSRRNLDMSVWGIERLDDELNAAADAYARLWPEEVKAWIS